MSIRKVTKDYGLRQHELEAYKVETLEELERLKLALNGLQSPDQARDDNAVFVRGILAEAGITDAFDTDIANKCGEKAFHVLGAEWLRNYKWLCDCRVKVEAGGGLPQDIARLIDIAETLGQLKERIWWRHGVDPPTGAKRENLAVSARESRQALPKARAARDAHNAEERAEAEARKRSFQAKADAIWQRHIGWGKSQVARQIISDWPKRDDKGRPNFNTLRTQLKKPDEA